MSIRRWVFTLFAFTSTIIFTHLCRAQISSQFFADHVMYNNTPWPSTVNVQFSSWRSLSSDVKWSDLNSAPGVYNWTTLDQRLATAEQYGQTVMYSLYYTPAWASQCPKCNCTPILPPGGCYPPQ